MTENDSASTEHTDGTDVTDVDDATPSGLPDWLPAVLRGGATMVAAGIVLALALALTSPDDSGSADSQDSTPSGEPLDAAPATTTSPPATAAAPTTVADAAATSEAPPATTAAPSPPTAPPPDATEPVDERCQSYSVDEELPVGICDRGALVAEVQTALTAADFTVEVDGFFTSSTEEAVMQFQAREGLEQDGLVGPQTAEALGIG